MTFNWKVALAGLLSVSLGLATARAGDVATASISDAAYSAGGEAAALADCGAQKSCETKLDSCCEGELVPFELIPETCSGWKIGGWTQIGYHSDNSVADLFNQYDDHVALHQQWVYIEKAADGTCGLDWGFRFDAMYGIDADNTQAFGNPGGRWDNSAAFDHGAYGWALPQAYVEVAYSDLSVKIGHFYTLVGYEVVPAPMNFFYSHAFAMNNSEPFTHTGALATWQVTDRLSVSGGWTAGWDTGYDQFEDGSNWLGGFSYALTDSIDFIYMSTYGDFGTYGGASLGSDCYEHTVILDVDITERLNYVFESDLLKMSDLAGNTSQHFGINNYLFYTLNDCWAFGARVEWWHNDLAGPALSVNAATFGVNYRPHTNLVIRPEVKQEWVPSQLAGPVFDNTIFGIDMVLTY